jgi:hypothetical protein
MKIATEDFYDELTETVNTLRDKMQGYDMSKIEFRIDVDGRVNDGDLRIIFHLSGSYGDPRVEGNSIEAVFEEFARRKGWEDRHSALLLSYDGLLSKEVTDAELAK